VPANGNKSKTFIRSSAVSDVATEDENNDVLVYPSPARERILVSFPEIENCDHKSVLMRLMGTDGRVKKTVCLPRGRVRNFEISVADIQPGLYILSVECGKQRRLCRFIKH